MDGKECTAALRECENTIFAMQEKIKAIKIEFCKSQQDKLKIGDIVQSKYTGEDIKVASVGICGWKEAFIGISKGYRKNRKGEWSKRAEYIYGGVIKNGIGYGFGGDEILTDE